jgi:hypothetical protein
MGRYGVQFRCHIRTRAAAHKVSGERANERALALAPVLAEIRAIGSPSLYTIGAELMRRGIPTANGKRFWGASQVRNLLKAAGSA